MPRQSSPFNFLLVLIPYIFSAIFFASFISFVDAQSYRPDASYQTAYDSVDGKVFYILGGTASLSHPVPLSQAFTIDLSVPWNANNPSYKKMPDKPGTPCTGYALTSKGWLEIARGDGFLYNSSTAIWGNIFTSTNAVIPDNICYRGVTDPESGLVYIPYGYKDATNKRFMLQANMTSRVLEGIPMVHNTSFINHFSVAWSVSLKSMVFLGGPDVIDTSRIFIYNASKGWNTLTQSAKGTIPSPRIYPCFVPYGDSKMVFFGGEDAMGLTTYNDIYVLDLTTLTWTKGQDLPPESSRHGAACAVSNGQFIAWGGSRKTNTTESIPIDTTIIYNLKANTWTSAYVAPDLPNTSPPTTPSTDPITSSGSGSRIVVIVVAAGLGVCTLVIVVAAGYMCRSRFRSNKKTQPDLRDHDEDLTSSTRKGNPQKSGLGANPHANTEGKHAPQHYSYSADLHAIADVEQRYPVHPHAIMDNQNANIVVHEAPFGTMRPVVHPQALVHPSGWQDKDMPETVYRTHPVRQNPHAKVDTMMANDLMDAILTRQNPHISVAAPNPEYPTYHIPRSSYQ